jgi:UrcA family protein
MTNTKNAMRTLAVFAVAAGLSTAAFAVADSQISVSAGQNAATTVASVNVGDLNLTQHADRMALQARLASAVRSVCTANGRMPSDIGCSSDAAADAGRQAQSLIAQANSHQAVASRAVITVHGAN